MNNIPNALTLSRLVAIIPIFVLIVDNEPQSFLFATILFSFAAATDFLDGFIARHFNFISTSGIFLDLTVDKIFISAILLALVQVEIIPAWIAAVIVTGQISMTGLRSLAIDQGRNITAGKWGKRNTAFVFIAIEGILFAKGLNAHQLSLFPPRLVFNSRTLQINEILLLGVEILLSLSVPLSVLFGARYIIRKVRHFQKEDRTEPG